MVIYNFRFFRRRELTGLVRIVRKDAGITFDRVRPTQFRDLGAAKFELNGVDTFGAGRSDDRVSPWGQRL
jgi:hypothetical protein